MIWMPKTCENGKRESKRGSLASFGPPAALKNNLAALSLHPNFRDISKQQIKESDFFNYQR